MFKRGFDLIAPWYDTLARIIFGKAIRRSQIVFLKHIPEQSRILIIGGGTGWILCELLARTTPKQVVYIEASQNMLNLARQKIKHPAQAAGIEFRLGNQKDIRPDEKFEVIISHFLLDLFLPSQLNGITQILFKCLRPGGYWLVADFVKVPGVGIGQLWTRILIRSMYVFFRVVSGINAGKLPDWQNILTGYALIPQKSAYFYHNMIKSVFYQKPDL